jgi:N-acetyl-anhydromuramyl-L-alanine amidase AmpD
LSEADGKGGWRVVEGRSLSLPGAHCPGRNQIDLGICLIGDFTKAPPPDEQLRVTAELCADLCERWGILPMDIRPHRAFRKTECPGRAFDNFRFKAFQDQVMQILVHG